MNPIIFKQVPLYRFLDFCLQTGSPEMKNILDCGAGGTMPPLALFKLHGIQTTGIELDSKAIEEADNFSKLHKFFLYCNFLFFSFFYFLFFNFFKIYFFSIFPQIIHLF